MGKHRLQLILNLLYFLISSDLRLSSTANIFAKDFFKNTEILFHTNCHNELQSLILGSHNSGLSVSYYDFMLDAMEEIQWQTTGFSISPLFLYICPNNSSDAVLRLKEISTIYYAEEQPFVTATYFIQWPELSSTGLENIISTLKQENVEQIIQTYPMNADVYLSVNYNEKNYQLTNTSTKSALIELYSVHRNVSVIQVIWDTYSIYKITHEYIIRKVARRWNFWGAPVRGAVFKDTTWFNAETSYIQPTILFEAISKAYNFTFIEINGTGWIGPYFKDPTTVTDAPLTAMGQQILSGEADVTVQYGELLMYRLQHLYMGPRFLSTGLFIMFRQPPANLWRNIYIKAFHPDVWVVYLVTWILLISTILVAFIIKRRRKGFGSPSGTIKIMYSEISQDALVWFISSVTMRGVNISTSTFSLKIIRFTALLFVVVCYTFYASSLFSILSNQKGPIQTYDDFIKSGIPVVSDVRAIRGTEFLKLSKPHQIVTEIYRKRGLFIDDAFIDKNVLDPFTAADGLLNSSVAVLSERDVWFQHLPCINELLVTDWCQKFHKLQISLETTGGAGMYMHKNSSMRKFLTFPIFVMAEDGIKHRQTTFRAADNIYYCTYHEAVPSLGNNDVFTVYILLGIGIVASLIFIVVEKVVSYCILTRTKYEY